MPSRLLVARFDDPTIQRVGDAADAQGVTISDFIREAVAAKLGTPEQETSPPGPEAA